MSTGEPVVKLNKGVPKMGTQAFLDYVKEQHEKLNEPRYVTTEKGRKYFESLADPEKEVGK